MDKNALVIMMEEHMPEYYIAGTLGSGSFSTVFHVKSLTREYAIKVTNLMLFRAGAEVSIAHVLQHPGICRLHRVYTGKGYAFLLMDYIDGITIKKLVDNTQLCMSEKLRISIEICKALQYMHKKNVAHRDIKLENIMMRKSDRSIVVIDFGFSKQSLNEAAATTLCGTTSLIAPEVFSGRYNPFLADLWSTGLLIFYIFNGRYPYQGIVPSEESFLLPHSYKDDKDVSMDTSANDIVDKLIRLSPSSRWQWDQLISALEDLVPSSDSTKRTPDHIV